MEKRTRFKPFGQNRNPFIWIDQRELCVSALNRADELIHAIGAGQLNQLIRLAAPAVEDRASLGVTFGNFPNHGKTDEFTVGAFGRNLA